MSFTEKLKRLTGDRIKSKLCTRIGLPKTAINDMISKGYTPKTETALKLARVLGVSVEWLIDDSQEWPPNFRPLDRRAAVA